jgi:hypothetical protein
MTKLKISALLISGLLAGGILSYCFLCKDVGGPDHPDLKNIYNKLAAIEKLLGKCSGGVAPEIDCSIPVTNNFNLARDFIQTLNAVKETLGKVLLKEMPGKYQVSTWSTGSGKDARYGYVIINTETGKVENWYVK